jgi:SAM-dependent methyltransferase/PAS domain-containing protein
VFAADDIVKLRDETLSSVRDNVLFELGLFMGKLGKERVFFILPENQGSLRLPSDLLGISTVTFDDSRSNIEAAFGPACFKILRAIEKHGVRQERLAPTRVDAQPKQQEPATLVSYGDGDKWDAAASLLKEWNVTNQTGLALLYNIEVQSFRNPLSFQRAWADLGTLKSISKIILLLPNYKIQRLLEFVRTYEQDFMQYPGHERFYIAEFKESSHTSGAHSATGVGFAMFRFGENPKVGKNHPSSQVFVFSPPFSQPFDPETSDATLTWKYRYALAVHQNPLIEQLLEDLWNDRFASGRVRTLVDALRQPDREDTIKREKQVAPLIRTGRLEEDPFETTLRIRAKLFDPNVPSYVLDENYRLLDWNPAFELTFPTDKFVRGENVTHFLKCLENYDEVLERGRDFLKRVPLYHVEQFVYTHPVYKGMRFTKLTSPVTDQKTGDYVGWNLALNVDAVEELRLYAEDRRQATELDALISHYAGSYDCIMSGFPAYLDLVERHVRALASANSVLDVGAGPGFLTRKLLDVGKNVTAVDNNDEMLLLLRGRCLDFLGNAGLKITKVNVEVLNGLEAKYDGAAMLNVLFTLSRPKHCLRRIFDLLKPGGVLALSGPTTSASINDVFHAVEEARNRDRSRSAVKEDRWRAAWNIFRDVNNEFEFKKMINRYSIDQTVEMLRECGFHISEQDIVDHVYAGQGVFMVARKP